MAVHNVKCLYCGKIFDAKPEEEGKVWIKPRSNRYAHKECDEAAGGVPPKVERKPKATPAPEDSELTQLKAFIQLIYGSSANWPLIMKQIKSFREKGMSYNSIQKTLEFFYVVQHNPVSGSNGGIGIVEFAEAPARTYYYDIWQAQQNMNASPPIVKKESEVYINRPKERRKVRLLEIEE